ncbi:DUF3593 domain-containing protein [Synechococcus sp. RedBA-s]|uniref:DUF3593 domain-containing protein n=1 Tax=Synechococcus sp. RedBA-s TaxID=2823741 RepID=UPI0037DA5D13|nr:DUF3593 domain-containing protein [Synechococcus sp. RedBA-s]
MTVLGLGALAAVDPSPLFVLSLLPYLAFLRWAAASKRFPPLALRGFQFTLVFVAVTIAAAVVAEQRFGLQLADVDPLHGGAEVFLTVANLMVLWGFSRTDSRTDNGADNLAVRGQQPADPEAQATGPGSEQVLSAGDPPAVPPQDGASVFDPP